MSLSLKKRTIYELSKYGNVMDIQLPIQFIHRRLPSKSEVIKAVEALNLQPEDRMRVRIKEYVYDVKSFGIITAEENVHMMPGYDLPSEQITENGNDNTHCSR